MRNNAQINYTGLRKRPTFEGIVDYLANGQEKTKYPNREAKQIRNHPYLTQLDGIGMFEMQEQQENAWKEQEKERVMKQLGIQGKRDAGGQVKTVSNEDWDKMMSDADMVISETRESMRKDRNNVETKFQTREPMQALRTGSRSMLDDAMDREMQFSLRSIRPSMASSSKAPTPEVYFVEQTSRGPPPPPGAAGAVAIPTKNYTKLASKALSMGYNAVYYAGAGGYYFFKFTSDVGKVTVPILLGLGQFLEGVNPSAGIHRAFEGFANEDDDDNTLEIEDDAPSIPSSVQPPGMSSGRAVKSNPKAPKTGASKESFSLARATGPSIRSTVENMRSAGDRRRIDKAVQRAVGVPA
jgi:hypothetical protein